MATSSTDKPARSSAPDPAPPGPPESAGAPALDPRLRSELSGPGWEQSWELTPTLHTAALDPGSRQRSWTLAEMLRPQVHDAFALGERRLALDLHCGEGWLAQRLLAWGARRVVAVDHRAECLRRARLLRDHHAIRAAELEFVEESEWVAPEPAERFEVVLLTGAPQRALEPEALARAHAASSSICAIECAGTDSNAVAELALAAGFGSVDRMHPPLHGAPTYVVAERDVLIARRVIGR